MQKITFFTGKGGVGKSMVASAWAESRRRQGSRVLLVELGSRSFYAPAFQWPQPSLKPIEVEPGLSLALWHGPLVLREYVFHLLKSETLVRLFFENSVMKTFLQAAPGISELAIIGKITSGIRKVGPVLDYDEIIVDCYSTGHALSLLRVASAMLEVIRIGPMAEQCHTIVQTLTNSAISRYVIVTLDGELPRNEAIELFHALNKELGIRPHLILNRQMIPPVSEVSLNNCVDSLKGAGHFCRFLRDRCRRQKAARLELENQIHGQVTVLPLVPDSELKKIQEVLATELEGMELADG